MNKRAYWEGFSERCLSLGVDPLALEKQAAGIISALRLANRAREAVQLTPEELEAKYGPNPMKRLGYGLGGMMGGALVGGAAGYGAHSMGGVPFEWSVTPGIMAGGLLGLIGGNVLPMEPSPSPPG